QRVDLEQCQIALHKQFGELQEDVGKLLDLCGIQSQLEGKLTALVGLGTNQRIYGGFENKFRRLVRYLFDIHAAFDGSHEYDTTRSAIDNGTKVELAGDISAGLHQYLADR